MFLYALIVILNDVISNDALYEVNIMLKIIISSVVIPNDYYA